MFWLLMLPLIVLCVFIVFFVCDGPFHWFIVFFCVCMGFIVSFEFDGPSFCCFIVFIYLFLVCRMEPGLLAAWLPG